MINIMIYILLGSTACMAISGLPGLLSGRRGIMGQWIAMALNVLASSAGVAALLWFAGSGCHSGTVDWNWALPWGRFAVGLDVMTGVFLLPILGISALGSIYGLGYWKQTQHPGDGRKLRFFWGLMSAGMMLVTLARDGVLFLMAWEIMATAAFFLITTEDQQEDVRAAGWIYLIAAHLGMLCLVAMFVLLCWTTGSFNLWVTTNAPAASGMATAIFLLGLVGFGLKAGIMPLHVWLPGAHANAPSHVSALFSGVMLNIGIYGLVRIGGIFSTPPMWWGATLFIMGIGSAVVAMIFAVCQNDYKRLLAYSSIENMGIVCLGIGLAMIGRAWNRPDLIWLGLGGALFHMLNHSLFKPLLFMGAGNILHATHTRRMDRLGGLAKKMPVTSILFFIGAMAICGLPGLNGFLGEWLIYLGLLHTVPTGHLESGVWLSLGAPALAVTGALAITGFVKLSGAVFLGNQRSADIDHAHDPGFSALVPMMILALGCVVVALIPTVITPTLVRAVQNWDTGLMSTHANSLMPAPVYYVAILDALLLVAGIALTLTLWAVRRRGTAAQPPTWSCGYTRPVPRMQYTGSSFSRMLAQMFTWMIPGKPFTPAPGKYFPQPATWTQDVPDTLLDNALIPGFGLLQRLFLWLRPLQNKPVNIYLAYMLGILLVLLIVLRF